MLIELITDNSEIIDIYTDEPTALPGQKYRLPQNPTSINSPNKFKIKFGPNKKEQGPQPESADENG